MDFLLGGLTVFGLVLVAAMSPGPDFLIVIRNSLQKGRHSGIWTSWGIAAAIFVHVGYCLAGIGVMIEQSIVLFNIIKWLGAAYLLYVGVMALRSKGWDIDQKLETAEENNVLPQPRANAWRAFRSGFVTNLFNPKATLFFLALFTQAIDPQTPIAIQFIYGCVCAATAGSWFTIVSIILTKDKLRQVFSGYSLWIDRICGLAFVAVALRLALVKAP